MALILEDVNKSFGNLKVLEGISFEVEDGEIACIVGPSGCGKTTLLRVIAGLEPKDSGRILWNEREIDREKIGFVFQDYTLLPWRTVLGNVEFGLELRRVEKRERRKKALSLIELVGLKGFENRFPKELSGGMKQRVGIARALATDPAIIVADEPTGDLDSETGAQIMELFEKLNKELGKTLIIVTHDETLIRPGMRVLRMQDGKLVENRIA